ncbi:hypothetical protein A9Z42_0080020 [Trichoderma parareesei]|uniref:Uncharacterized protein n=1 Tax=Trichoderma parareesei TaxID=858221 RepID=A0A2H2ZK86_TRIPA|nr:hypothetical protein A9Z42_0080020 [Trichoderma parareesei]
MLPGRLPSIFAASLTCLGVSFEPIPAHGWDDRESPDCRLPTAGYGRPYLNLPGHVEPAKSEQRYAYLQQPNQAFRRIRDEAKCAETDTSD